jgi:hypothetical protein
MLPLPVADKFLHSAGQFATHRLVMISRLVVDRGLLLDPNHDRVARAELHFAKALALAP